MTPGQERALRDLTRLHLAAPDSFEVIGVPKEKNGRVIATVSLRSGPLEKRPGGLDLREREEFKLSIPPDYPFEYPGLSVTHARFAGFPHVIWAKTLCLYQSKLEWNPADGLFGYFDRLALWLARAVRNDMDPVEGPLEPPHHITDFSQQPIVIRSNVPVHPGQRWIGWACLEKLSNRIELTGWTEFADDLPGDERAALAIILSEPMPMEFPEQGGELFAELLRRDIDRAMLLRLLGLAAYVTPQGEPIHLVVGLPMRRAQGGEPRLHIAVWTTSAKHAESLRLALPAPEDSDALRNLRQDLADSIYEFFELTSIKWCQVLEDRDEIVVRRDAQSPVAWFEGKKIAILGAGALGSWVAEIAARARPTAIHLVDNSIVSPGLLARQNFTLADIGTGKALALSTRLSAIANGADIQPFHKDAHVFALEDLDRLSTYDLVVDCTASRSVQMKLERDWNLLQGRVRRFVSVVIDARAQRFIAVSLPPQADDGPWSAYLRWQYELTADGGHGDIAKAFYSPNATEPLFQPEPGCSDHTFVGSTADVFRLAATALNALLDTLPAVGETKGVACALPPLDGNAGTFTAKTLPPVQVAWAEGYRVLIARKVLNQARSFARQNNRLRSAAHETGGLLWGYWNDASGVIVVHDASGPPPDSRHEPAHFTCGIEGTQTEHSYRAEQTLGACGFLGFWHTHPDFLPQQSGEDIAGMADLVRRFGHNQRRALMLIFGRTASAASAGIYLYEAQTSSNRAEIRAAADQPLGFGHSVEFISVGHGQLSIAIPVV